MEAARIQGQQWAAEAIAMAAAGEAAGQLRKLYDEQHYNKTIRCVYIDY